MQPTNLRIDEPDDELGGMLLLVLPTVVVSRVLAHASPISMAARQTHKLFRTTQDDRYHWSPLLPTDQYRRWWRLQESAHGDRPDPTCAEENGEACDGTQKDTTPLVASPPPAEDAHVAAPLSDVRLCDAGAGMTGMGEQSQREHGEWCGGLMCCGPHCFIGSLCG